MEALNTLITGIPHTGVFTNYQLTANKPFATSIAPQFSKLGFTTNLFYGGYLSWQKLGDFAKKQGFDYVYGGSHMGEWNGNEWGVEDKQLFDFIYKTIRSAETPTFNLIMTTSNHPRYTVDLDKEGCGIASIPQSLAAVYDGSVPLKVLGHIRYADKCVGEFVDKIEGDALSCLFAITGDHWSRHFINKMPSEYEKSSVPLIIYSPGMGQDFGRKGAFKGGHHDIAPTLLNLVASEGYCFHSFGGNIFEYPDLILSNDVRALAWHASIVGDNL